MISFDDDLSDFTRDAPSEDIFERSTTSKSKLSSLFSDDVPKPISSTTIDSPPKPSNTAQTIFSSVVHIFAPNASNEYVSVGRGGLAIISKDNTSTLLLYTPTKQAITQLIFSPTSSFSLIHPYVYFKDMADKRWSIHFDDDDQLKRALAWMLIRSQRDNLILDLDLGIADAPLITEGNSLLINLSHYKEDQGLLQISDEKDIKLRLSSKKHKHEYERFLTGMRKGGVRMVYLPSGTAAVITVRKVRSKDTVDEVATTVAQDTVQEIDKAESEQSGDITTEHSSTPEPVPAVEESKHDALLKRMARLGTPMFGLAENSTVLQPTATVTTGEEAHIPPAAISDNETQITTFPSETALCMPTVSLSTEPDTVSNRDTVPGVPTVSNRDTVSSVPTVSLSTVPDTVSNRDTVSSVPTVSAPSYEDFHKVVGVEMDRLQIRLEAAFSRMLTEALAPIREQQTRLEQRQEEILAELRSKTAESE